MCFVQKVCSKIPSLILTVCRVSPIFIFCGREAFLEGTNVINTETLMAPFILAGVTLPKWTVSLDKLHSLLFPMTYKFTNLPHG